MRKRAFRPAFDSLSLRVTPSDIVAVGVATNSSILAIDGSQVSGLPCDAPYFQDDDGQVPNPLFDNNLPPIYFTD